MDFEPRYTEEQQTFRTEVRDWLKDNVPDDLANPADSADTTYDDYLQYRALGRDLGEKGWLWPTAPTEYGGGGLTIDHAIVLDEELDEYSLSLPPYYDSGGETMIRKNGSFLPYSRERSAPGSYSQNPTQALTLQGSR